MKTWEVFLRLQTKLAYGDEPIIEEPNVATLAAASYMQSVSKGEGAVVIGPGGPHEVSFFMREHGDLCVLTAHRPEADSIRATIPNAYVDVGDIHDMPYESGAFKFLTASNVLEHCFAPYIALMECRRVLRMGGTAQFVLPSFEGREGGVGPFHLHCLTKDVWMELLRKTGLHCEHVEVSRGEVLPDSYYMTFRCVAVQPPNPHNKLLEELMAFKRTA